MAFIFWQELEKSLKATCEEFIMSVTKLVVDPMLSFVTKVCFLSFRKNIKFNNLLRFVKRIFINKLRNQAA